MPLVPWRPFKDLENFFEALEPTAEEGGTVSPKLNVYETKKDVVAEAELPGIKPEDVDIEIKDNVLKIEARTEKKEEKEEKGYYRREFSRGFYRRVTPLPVEVKDDKAEASYENGVLTVKMPKVEISQKEKKGKKIKIKSKK
jgi:HSP20 family protein